MTYLPEKQKTLYWSMKQRKDLLHLWGSFSLDQITEDLVQTEATKFFARVAEEVGS